MHVHARNSICDELPFSVTAVLLSGTIGCGSILSLDADGNIVAIGDGDTSATLTYDGQNATMYNLAEVDYDS